MPFRIERCLHEGGFQKVDTAVELIDHVRFVSFRWPHLTIGIRNDAELSQNRRCQLSVGMGLFCDGTLLKQCRL